MSCHYRISEEAFNRLERAQAVVDLLADVLPEVGARNGAMKSVTADGIAALHSLLNDELAAVRTGCEFRIEGGQNDE